ncbi:MAG TPA: hypothetical protein VKB84_25540 [Candidatus Binataceae bacterium]|jgi:hypothetical protein|nr:hypothetical protein [Candidatus Binataceae bacterium]
MSRWERSAAPRRIIKAFKRRLAPLWAELRRLNSLGLGATQGQSSRGARSAAMRAALSRKYRDQSPCC